MMLDDAVDHDPGGQGVPGPAQPSGQGQAAAGLLGAGPGGPDVERRLAVGQNRWDAGPNDLYRVLAIAAAIYESRRRLAAVPEAGDGRLGQHALLQGRHLL